MKRSIDINLYAYGNAAGNTACKNGPHILKSAIEKTLPPQTYHFISHLSVDNHYQQAAAIPDIVHLSTCLSTSTEHAVSNHRFFVTIGGDHSAAIGSWSGAAKAVPSLGLIWFDAHMDAHTPQTTPSHNIHGMPLAILLGHGESALTHIATPHPKIDPHNVVLIGVRSFESGEATLLNKLGVKIFYMDDIKQLGMKTVIEQAIQIVTEHTTQFGISIDLDGFDPIDVPGVGSPAPDGIQTNDFLRYFPLIAAHPKLIGADIVEFNPEKDHDQKTEKVAIQLLNALITDETR